MKRDIRDFLNDILHYSAKAQEVAGRKEAEFFADNDEGMGIVLYVVRENLPLLETVAKKILHEIEAQL
jgi:uncharacterized protein with HEPN domain